MLAIRASGRADSTATIADGIAIKRPGQVTRPLVERLVDELCVVGDEEVAEAIVRLLERAKLVVEGAGAVGVAALLEGVVGPAREGATVVVLSGGNIDAGLLAAVARRHETAAGRRLRVFTRISDRPAAWPRCSPRSRPRAATSSPSTTCATRSS